MTGIAATLRRWAEPCFPFMEPPQAKSPQYWDHLGAEYRKAPSDSDSQHFGHVKGLYEFVEITRLPVCYPTFFFQFHGPIFLLFIEAQPTLDAISFEVGDYIFCLNIFHLDSYTISGQTYKQINI